MRMRDHNGATRASICWLCALQRVALLTAPMPRLVLSAIALLLASCTSTFTDASKLPCKVTHRLEGSKLIATATVTNESESTVTFVEHPCFRGLLLEAATPTKQKRVGLTGLIHFIRATRRDVVRVRPGGQFTYERPFPIQRRDSEALEWTTYIARERTWDSRVRLKFHYGTSSEHFPKHAWALGTNYVMTELKAEEIFPRP
jgi:hypothetical protein